MFIKDKAGNYWNTKKIIKIETNKSNKDNTIIDYTIIVNIFNRDSYFDVSKEEIDKIINKGENI